MRRLIFFLSFFLLTSTICSYSESNGTNDQRRNEHIICPTLGFGVMGTTTGFDFFYRHSSGFALFCNLNVSIPTAQMAGLFVHPELYIGYSLKRGNFYANFTAGAWGGGGFYPYDYRLKRNIHGELVAEREDFPIIMGFFGIRNDYLYFFNDKFGINFSHTHGFGIYAGRWFTYDILAPYGFMVKMGLAVRL